jgi:hypothetical protein
MQWMEDFAQNVQGERVPPLVACASGEKHIDNEDRHQNQSPDDDVERAESENALFAREIGRRDMSLGVMVTVIGFGHLSSKNNRPILSEPSAGIQHAKCSGIYSSTNARRGEADLSAPQVGARANAVPLTQRRVAGDCFAQEGSNLRTPKRRVKFSCVYFTPLAGSHEPCSLRTKTIWPM